MFTGRAAFKGAQTISELAGKAATRLIGRKTDKPAPEAYPFIPDISASLGETQARQIWNAIGVDNYNPKNVLAAVRAVAGGTETGALISGPVGAAGITSGSTSELGRKSPNNNWFYTVTGIIDGIVRFLRYFLSNIFYSWQQLPYWPEYLSADSCVFFMSAGMAQNEKFQVSLRDRQDRRNY